MSETTLHVIDNTEGKRYEAALPQGTAYIEYRPVGNALMLTHTEVPEAMEGQGVGSTLVKFALDDIRERSMMVIPMCPFVAAYMQRHLEYADLVHPQQRGLFGLH
ncbi:GNAT family N-acetyltransferase [Deinococcus yavapaiensis]|uniref:N-acetyltransferase domain-containing protein n=1 Tax=Deinococcus yavapaiensis KR-236 TaxID=694435 RepID=A0A318SB73_9DEIO|nr:GNAT family N-acetyltransferase [Deinococcus yavapaiensis]PYE55470.1 hypothetical protein DES52_103303 [Deinococcus yavapaiensis KR-236]